MVGKWSAKLKTVSYFIRGLSTIAGIQKYPLIERPKRIDMKNLLLTKPLFLVRKKTLKSTRKIRKGKNINDVILCDKTREANDKPQTPIQNFEFKISFLSSVSLIADNSKTGKKTKLTISPIAPL